MHHLVALLAVVLSTGIDDFKADQPAPAELLEKLGPQLDATGSEELRVATVAEHAGKADPAERAASPDSAIRLVEFIRGREVRQTWVNIMLNIRTNEVTRVGLQRQRVDRTQFYQVSVSADTGEVIALQGRLVN